MDALCINPLFNVGIALGVGVCIGVVAALLLVAAGCKVRR